MIRRTSARRRLRLVTTGIALLAITSGTLVARSQLAASADGTAPPPTPANCPGQQHPPAGYALDGAYHDHTVPANVKNNLDSGAIGYLVPFKGTIGIPGGRGGTLEVPSTDPTKPGLAIPRIFGAVCGLIALPELTGFIFSTGVALRSLNAYIGTAPQVSQTYPNAIEALPLAVDFGTQVATVDQTPAHNGGLDATLGGQQEATISVDGSPYGQKNPNALGTSCPLKLTLQFSTKSVAQMGGQTFTGQPVTGPVMAGQAEVVSNNFSVPAVQPGPTCPAVVAQAVNRLLGLPLPPGRAVFDAPVTFDFEINQP